MTLTKKDPNTGNLDLDNFFQRLESGGQEPYDASPDQDNNTYPRLGSCFETKEEADSFNQKIILLYADGPQSGKTTCSKILNQRGFETVSLASPIKNMLHVLYAELDYDPEEIHKMLYGDRKEEAVLNNASTRQLLQTLGTDWVQKAGIRNIWLYIVCEKIEKIKQRGKHVVIDDVRFMHEITPLKNFRDNVKTIKVINPKATQKYQSSGKSHVSEGSLNRHEPDLFILNNGSYEQLAMFINRMVDALENKDELFWLKDTKTFEPKTYEVNKIGGLF